MSTKYAKLIRRKSPKTVKCSFCGKGREQVKRIITGPSVYICSECVNLCSQILAGKEADPSGEAGQA